MKEYTRKYPEFSLCGLNCCLCPQFQTEAASKCPGCGGPEFHCKHPSCSVINCSKKHGDIEFCYQCSAYPCEKYNSQKEEDSFITYRNVNKDFTAVKTDGIDVYISKLREKQQILEYLIRNYNDGRRKSYYCLAVNLLELDGLKHIIKITEKDISDPDEPLKDKILKLIALIEEQAGKENVQLKLRKTK